MSGPTVVDVFSGAGGLALGFLQEFGPSAHLVAAVDSDSSLQDVFALNFPRTRFLARALAPFEDGDADWFVGQLPGGIGAVDVLLAGPPCQPFSPAGKRGGGGDLDGRLALRVAEFVRALAPTVVVVENVPEFARAEGGRLVGRLRVQLVQAGYASVTFMVNATELGLPQSRLRCFIIAVRKDVGCDPRDLVPPATYHSVTATGRLLRGMHLPQPPTIAEAIGDLPTLASGAGEEVTSYEAAPSSDYQALLRTGSQHIHNHVAVRHSDGVLAAMRLLAPGDTPQRELGHPLRPKEYFRSAYARLAPDGVAPTMTTQTHNPGSGRFTHYSQHRVLTVREVARLQGFPDSFRFTGAMEAQRRHVGNAVPPPMAAAIARRIAEGVGSATWADRALDQCNAEGPLEEHPSGEGSEIRAA